MTDLSLSIWLEDLSTKHLVVEEDFFEEYTKDILLSNDVGLVMETWSKQDALVGASIALAKGFNASAVTMRVDIRVVHIIKITF